MNRLIILLIGIAFVGCGNVFSQTIKNNSIQTDSLSEIIEDFEVPDGVVYLKGRTFVYSHIGFETNMSVIMIHRSAKPIITDTLPFLSDSAGFFEYGLIPELEYHIVFWKAGFESKLVVVDTRNSGKYKGGYEIPIEVSLETGKNRLDNLVPVGMYFYNKETDLYELKRNNLNAK